MIAKWVSWFPGVLGCVAFVALLATTSGCVSPETAAKYDAAVAEVKEAKAKVDSIKDQIEKLKADFDSGTLKANEVTARLAILNTELQAAIQDGKQATEKAKAYAEAPEPWWDKVGYVLMSLVGVALGRKIGLPGLASGSKPLPFLGGDNS